MTKIIVVASGKGGVGKSTITSSLGRMLAKMGNRTLLIDMDAGLAGLDLMLDVSGQAVFNWADVVNEDCDIDKATIEVSDNLYLLPAPDSYINDITSEQFELAFSDLDDSDYDFILLDAPAGLGHGLRRASSIADRAIVVSTADNISSKAAKIVRDKLDEYGVPQTRLIINRFRKKPTLQGNYLNIDNTIDKAGVQLIGIIPEDYGIQYVSMEGKFKDNKSSTVTAFERIARRLCGENVSLDLRKLK